MIRRGKERMKSSMHHDDDYNQHADDDDYDQHDDDDYNQHNDDETIVTSSVQHHPTPYDDFHAAQHENQNHTNEANIVRQIASFMSLTDATSSVTDQNRVASWSSFITTPETPGLMALSPDVDDDEHYDEWALKHQQDEREYSSYMQQQQQQQQQHHSESSPSLIDIDLQQRLADRQRRYVTQKLATAVFSHPQPLRSFCVKAHQAATAISRQQRQQQQNQPESTHPKRKPNIFEYFVHAVFQNNVPLSVLRHMLRAVRDLTLDTLAAMTNIAIDSLQALIRAILHGLTSLYRATTQFHRSPDQSLLSSSTSSAAAMALLGSAAAGGMGAVTGVLDPKSQKMLEKNQKLLERLSQLNAAAHVIEYWEREDDALTRHAKQRVQRMMHYDVSLRPFVATVVVDNRNNDNTSITASTPPRPPSYDSPPTSPFMCTPKSFPPTPASRSLVLARGSKFAEDVIFLARDKLRVEDGLGSSNERTRAMAQALRQASRLAVFAADRAEEGASFILLTCGQHVATKVNAHALYCSTRSMVPILRNCYAYFEMTVLPTVSNSHNINATLASLSIGLSTLEMPLNTLVGAWKGSVGLCSTGQMLTGGQWDSHAGHTKLAYGESATVGCLVCLDDGSAFETWDGVMVTARVVFTVYTPSPNGSTRSMNTTTSSPLTTTTEEEESEETSTALPTTVPKPTGPPSNITTTMTSLLVPMEEELFPTLTLHSPGTQVMCRFSAQDVILATSRKDISAPLHESVPVYAIDGSVIFGPSDDDDEDDEVSES